MQLQLPETVKVKGIRVLTTRQLAQAYETTRQIISYNFNYNKHRYMEGKHSRNVGNASLQESNEWLSSGIHSGRRWLHEHPGRN